MVINIILGAIVVSSLMILTVCKIKVKEKNIRYIEIRELKK